MSFFFDLLAHKMISRNVRFIRAGVTYRWFLLAFWICFAVYAVTRWTILGIVCGVLLLCAVLARAWWRPRQLAEIRRLLVDDDEHAV